MSKKEQTIEEKIIGSWKKVISNPDMALVLKDILNECGVDEAVALAGMSDSPNMAIGMGMREGERRIGIFINERLEDANK